MITDPQGSIEYVNRKFSLLTGFSREEVIGRNPRLLKSGVQQPEVYTNLWRTICGGQRMARRAVQSEEGRRAVLGARRDLRHP